MIVIPAVDLLDGACVRLFRGNYSDVTVYGADPVDTVKRFLDAGALRIHIVDLDAARGRGRTNRTQIERIRNAVPCQLEVGGGVRTETDVRELVELGVDRLIVGTVLAKAPDTVADWVSRYGRRFIAGIDAYDGAVKVSGWENEAETSDTELAVKAAAAGACSIVYTNISRYGTLSGPDLPRTKLIARASGLPVILSGGVSSEQDLEDASREESSGIVAAITGKALYEGRIDLARAVARFQTALAQEAAW